MNEGRKRDRKTKQRNLACCTTELAGSIAVVGTSTGEFGQRTEAGNLKGQKRRRITVLVFTHAQLCFASSQAKCGAHRIKVTFPFFVPLMQLMRVGSSRQCSLAIT
jgi:hypothetical protein